VTYRQVIAIAKLWAKHSWNRKVHLMEANNQPAIEQAKTDKAQAWSLDLIKSLDWKVFEALCAAYFKAKGHNAEVSKIGADGGIDILLYERINTDKLLGVVQCKAWATKPVGVREVRELYGVMADIGCLLGVLITTSRFTEDARSFASGKHISLMTVEKLLALILGLPENLKTELLYQTTQGDYTVPSCPNCDIKLVSRVASKGKSLGQHFWGCSNFPKCRYMLHRR